MKKLLVANRGEIAVRVFRSARSLGLATVAVHSEADAGSLHVASADEAVAIGPAKPTESYLKPAAIIEAARDTGADAIHPGYGFLAENAGFAAAVEGAGLIFVGPTPSQIAAMGDKERARATAEAAGLPVLKGSRRFAEGDRQGLADEAARVGYPLLVKAAAGGGGIGMRVVESEADLAKAVEATQALAARSFGDGTIFLERYIRNARHIEAQVFGLGDGRAAHLFERECSIQRRFQKVVEESPSPSISPATRERLCAAAEALARVVSYRSAGTVEFVVDGDTEEFFFLEMNTRIQVEHPVTEMTTGLDLVALQLRLARGEDLGAELAPGRILAAGHAIECRICAENPSKMFLPSPGHLAGLSLPAGPGIRVDSGVREGDQVTHHYDSLIAKLIVHGGTRAEAIERMKAALGEVRVDGIVSNAAMLARIVGHEAFRAGRTPTNFIEIHKTDVVV